MKRHQTTGAVFYIVGYGQWKQVLIEAFKRDASEAMTRQTSSVPSPPQMPRKKNRNSIHRQRKKKPTRGATWNMQSSWRGTLNQGVAARSGVQRPSAAFDTLPPRRGKKRKRGNEGLTEHDCPVC